MESNRVRSFVFVEANPATGDKRTGALDRKAKSHAALKVNRARLKPRDNSSSTQGQATTKHKQCNTSNDVWTTEDDELPATTGKVSRHTNRPKLPNQTRFPKS